MNLRIRYTDHKFKQQHKISMRAFTSASTGAKYRVILNLSNPDAMEYYIRNERTKEYVFKSGTYTNENVLKRAARAKLSKYGVKTGKENRSRSFGVCPKGFTQEEWERQELYGRENSDTKEE